MDKEKFKFEFEYNKNYAVVVGNNGSGKTTLSRFLLKSVPRNKLYILNAGAEDDWLLSANKDHITIPDVYDLKWFNRWILKTVVETEEQEGMCIVLDDADNFQIKKSMALKSVFINSRRLNIGGLLTVRKLNWVPIEIYEKAKYVFIFRQNVDYHIWYIANLVGMDNAKTLRSLPDFTAFAYEPNTGKHWTVRSPQM